MINSSLQRIIYEKTALKSYDDNYQRLIVSCVLYKYIVSILKANSSGANSISSLADSYLGIITSQIKTFKKSYVSYIEMERLIKNSGKTRFLDFPERLINDIQKLFLNKTKIEDFSPYKFSPAMYRIGNLSFRDYNRLVAIHNSIMVPIAEFYRSNFQKNYSDLKINDSNIGSYPGKVIKFAISGIDTSKIVGDIKLGRIGIESLLYDAICDDSFISITVN